MGSYGVALYILLGQGFDIVISLIGPLAPALILPFAQHTLRSKYDNEQAWRQKHREKLVGEGVSPALSHLETSEEPSLAGFLNLIESGGEIWLDRDWWVESLDIDEGTERRLLEHDGDLVSLVEEVEEGLPRSVANSARLLRRFVNPSSRTRVSSW